MQNAHYGDPQKINTRGRLLKAHLEDFELEAHTMPTHHKSFITKDVLNIVLTHKNKFFSIEKITSLEDIGSDHLPVLIELGNVSLDKTLKNIKLYNKIDKKFVVETLNKRNKDKAFTVPEIDNKIRKLHDLLNEIDSPKNQTLA